MHWYIEANAQAGSVEGSIMLTHTAFELLAYSILVEHFHWLSADGFAKLGAAESMRLLFRWAGLPIDIPTELTNLSAIAKGNNWPDSPSAMTEIRNKLTHPTKKNRDAYKKYGVGAITDTWTLGLWYLELCLLRLFEYNGTYGSRLKKMRYSGAVEPVPWAAIADKSM